MKKLTKWQIISIIISVCIVAFIFSNSALPAEESSETSGAVLAYIESVMAKFGIDFAISHNLLRKIAHFGEFFVLGASFLVTTATFTTKIRRHLPKPIFTSLFVAITDETIQIFSSGRSSQVSDVLLDFFGAVCGVMLTYLIIYLISKKRCQV